MTATVPQPDPDWAESAACAGHPYPELWFPEDRTDRALSAKRICIGCDVRRDCGLATVIRDRRHGVWAGYRVDQRGGWLRLHDFLGLPRPQGPRR
ncbi:WhiB family transcriptional regulator [Nocardia testacea]|uniref:WhiB family transcriptional regulator n=1 Tax=Nocardia testacea TaxID=248551 RepID=UPI003C2D718D